MIWSLNHKMITGIENDFELLFYNSKSKTKASNLIHFKNRKSLVENDQNLTNHIDELNLTFIELKNQLLLSNSQWSNLSSESSNLTQVWAELTPECRNDFPGFLDVVDGYWRRMMLVALLRCWWLLIFLTLALDNDIWKMSPLYRFGRKHLEIVTNITLEYLKHTGWCARQLQWCCWQRYIGYFLCIKSVTNIPTLSCYQQILSPKSVTNIDLACKPLWQTKSSFSIFHRIDCP